MRRSHSGLLLVKRGRRVACKQFEERVLAYLLQRCNGFAYASLRAIPILAWKQAGCTGGSQGVTDHYVIAD